ncbi:MAG: glycosyltransferase family 2 protein [Bacteroidetes bacterium]|nr:glycosyltransferase family 2 protein [Bacteroidota bacterium]
MELCLLIPAKNEASSLPSTLSHYWDTLNSRIPFNFLIINDHSDDDSSEVLHELSNKYSNLFFVDNNFEGGVGNAIRYGLEVWKGDIVAICMADGSDSPFDILTSYNKICSRQVSCVFGSRFIKGSKIEGYPIAKLILNRIFNFLVKIISSNKYNDFTNIFKVYQRTAIEAIQPLESTGFSIGLEMSLKAFSKQLKIEIIPISWRQRTAGKSKLNLRKNTSLYLNTLIKSISAKE